MSLQLQQLEFQYDQAKRNYQLAVFETPKLHGLIERKWRRVENIKRRIQKLRRKER